MTQLCSRYDERQTRWRALSSRRALVKLARMTPGTHDMTSLDYYGIEELLTEEERAARDGARRFVQEEVLREIVPFHRAGKFPEHLIPRMGVLADSWWKRTCPGFVPTTSRENSVCACRAHRNAGLRTAAYLPRTVCPKHPDSARRCRVFHTRVQVLPGARSARQLTATKQRWLTRNRANNLAAPLPASN